MDRVFTFSDDLSLDGIIKVMGRYSEREIDIANGSIEGLHMHDCYEVYMNVDGEVSFVVEDRVYDISKGDIVITKPNEFHYCLFSKNILHKCHCLWIWVDMNSSLDRSLRKCVSGKSNLVPCEKSANGRMELFNKLYIKNVELLDIRRHLAILQIVDLIVNQKSISESLSQPIPGYIQEIIDYINENFPHIESLKDIYEKYNISPTALNRAFDRYLKISPAKYIESKRLSHAKSILLQGGSVMKAVADSGFADYSHFIRMFRLQFGVTPGKYYRENKYIN